MGETLRAILQALTRYSANDLELPVNDRTLFTGASREVRGRDRPTRDHFARSMRLIENRKCGHIIARYDLDR